VSAAFLWRRRGRPAPGARTAALGAASVLVAGAIAAVVVAAGTPRQLGAYLWQFYSPTDSGGFALLPAWPLRDVWLESSAAAFGWLEVRFPWPVYAAIAALLVALAVAFAYLFLRELLPGAPWAWPVGALALAVQPLLGFIGGGVNNDAGLFAAGAAVLWLVARAFRRGLDRATAIGLGAAFGLGLVVKASLVGLGPGLLAVLAVLLLREPPERRGRVLRLAGLATAVAAVPVVLYVVLNATVWDRPLWGSGVPGTAAATGGRTPQLLEFVGYVWQFYLPRLPFMDDQQSGIPLFNVWFQGFIGRYGWLDTSFPSWVYDAALAVFAVVAALAGRALWRGRRALTSRRGELLAYAAIVAGFLLVVAWAGYSGRLANGFIFEQARYLLPLGAFYAALITLAARGAGRPAAPALVVLACGHALLSVLLVAGRFYV
jgi:hypothetical protein